MVNSIVQGSAADVIKLAMVSLDDRLGAQLCGGAGARLVATIHDELLVECGEDQLGSVAAAVHGSMVGAAQLSVPLVVHLSAGVDWGSMHEFAAGDL